jgi:hypothetical protein
MPEQFITVITAITVLLATLMPARLAPLVPSAEGLAQILMQVGPCAAPTAAAGLGAAGGMCAALA